MSCFEKEGSWNLSFSGAGFLGLYHVGVIHCLRQRAPRLLRGASRFYGSSSGAPPRHAHGDLTSLAPHERLPEILVVPREKTPTGAGARGNP